MPLPAQGSITQGFGATNEPLDSGGVNKGIDISVPVGTPVQAVVEGTVIAAGDQGDGWGVSVKIRDKDGNIHNYGHLSSTDLKAGQIVSAGQTVGASGNTGNSTGPHLSYDVKSVDGEYIDPSPFVGAEPGTYAYDNRTEQSSQTTQIDSAIDKLMRDVPTDPDDLIFWGQSLASLLSLRRELQSGNDTVQQDFDNKIAELTGSLSYDTLNLDKAAQEIDRFLSGAQESRARAGMIADAKAEYQRYGSPSGQTSFSHADLGANFAANAAVLGIDPSAASLNYTGIVNLNPVADLNMFDQQFGVTGQIPGVPDLQTSPSLIPNAPTLTPPAQWSLPGGPPTMQSPINPSVTLRQQTDGSYGYGGPFENTGTSSVNPAWSSIGNPTSLVPYSTPGAPPTQQFSRPQPGSRVPSPIQYSRPAPGSR